MGIKKTFKVALSTSIALVLSLGTLSPAHATTSASGEICTIVGTSKNDKLKGTSGDDVICGLGGNDTMTGLGGDDHLDGGNGNDAIAGGDGNDDLEGGSGNDRLLGQGGNDELLGAAGNDYLDGGLAPDALDAGVGADTCIFAAEDTVADTCDNKAPTFSNVSFSSTSVDTNTSAQTIVVEFDVADNLAGIQDVQISIQLPSQAGTSSSPVRLSGDEMSAH
jgi:Ca2+-binding RTX toxin-like protein